MSAGGVIITMKAFVRHTIEIAPPPGLVPSSESADALMDRIVTWCIDEYFRGAPLS